MYKRQEYRIGYNLTKELLKERPDITAIAGLNDMIAFGIIDALHEDVYKRQEQYDKRRIQRINR